MLTATRTASAVVEPALLFMANYPTTRSVGFFSCVNLLFDECLPTESAEGQSRLRDGGRQRHRPAHGGAICGAFRQSSAGRPQTGETSRGGIGHSRRRRNRSEEHTSEL